MTGQGSGAEAMPDEHAVFEASWLQLREPVDHRSRAPELVDRLRDGWKRRFRFEEPPTAARAPWKGRIVDLGSGTGSNLRFLAGRLAGPQRWTLVDHDADLLDQAGPPGDDVEVRRLRRDLGDGPGEVIRGADLVTGSAFLDLASREWIEALVEGCGKWGAAAYFALTYDGTFRWRRDGARKDDPWRSGPDDARIREIVNAHQRRNKGLGGVSLGPDAAPLAAMLFEERGFRTWMRPSPWILGPEDSPLALRLLDGWEAAAREERPDRTREIHEWAALRRTAVAEGAFRLTVGHLDLLAMDGEPGRWA